MGGKKKGLFTKKGLLRGLATNNVKRKKMGEIARQNTTKEKLPGPVGGSKTALFIDKADSVLDQNCANKSRGRKRGGNSWGRSLRESGKMYSNS